MNKDEARRLTEDYRRADRAQWAKLLALYERNAHRALGYDGWDDYAWEELGLGSSDAYRILDAARVERALAVPHLGNDGLRVCHTRYLAPLLRAPDGAFEEVVRSLLGNGRGWKAITGADTQRAVDRWEVPRYVAEQQGNRRQQAVKKRVERVVRSVGHAISALAPEGAEGVDVAAALRDLPETEARRLADDLELLLSALRAGYENREGGKLAA